MVYNIYIYLMYTNYLSLRFFKKNPMDDKERCSIDDEDDDQFYQLKKSTKQTKIEGEEFDKGNEIKRRRGSEDNTKTEDQTGDTFT